MDRKGGVVTGRVRNARTGEPLDNVNIFLANTTIGTSSDVNGRFTISTIPVGSYELVFSSVGFDRISHVVRIVRNDSIFLSIILEPHDVQFGEVEVSAARDDNWNYNLRLFKDAFVGKGRFSDKCVILNPQVLEFRFDKKTDSLVASTDSIIHIQNLALGYFLHIALDEFRWDVRSEAGHYLFHLYFEEMKAHTRQESTSWGENRRLAIDGSLKQFLWGLYRGEIAVEKFSMFTGPKVELVQGQSHRVDAQDFESEQLEGVPLKWISFPEYLRVEGGKLASALVHNEWVEYHTGISLLHARESNILVDSLGNLFDPLSLEISGAWAMNRVSELLPKGMMVDSQDSLHLNLKDK
jgi:hypothetical protein